MEKTNIRAYTQKELAEILVQNGEKAFRAKQIWQWLWQKGRAFRYGWNTD